MKITEIRTHKVFCYRTNWVFVEIETDEGIHGIGECTLEYRENAVLGAIRDFRRAVIGRDPCRIESLFHDLYRDSYWRGGPVLMSALSGIEMALWDISAQALGVPVHRMLGGKVRDRIRIYVNGWFSGAKTPDEFADKARHTVKRGITAMKWDPFGDAYMDISPAQMDNALSCIGAVRDAVGSDIDLLIEAHGRFNTRTAIDISRRISEFRPLFLEEPVPPDNIAALAEVRSKSPVPIAAGERLYSRRDFRELFQLQAVDIVQPDVSHAGGILEVRKIAAAAETDYLFAAPHNPSGPVANAATLQLAAVVPNFCCWRLWPRMCRGAKKLPMNPWTLKTAASGFRINRVWVFRSTMNPWTTIRFSP